MHKSVFFHGALCETKYRMAICMNTFVCITAAAAVILVLCAAVLIYFIIYKKNINKALSENGDKPKRLIEPYKIVFAALVLLVSVAITVTSIAGLLYSNEYFKGEEDYLADISSYTVCVDKRLSDDKVFGVKPEDAENIKNILSEKYPAQKFNIIPIYTCQGVMMNGHVNLFAVDEKYCSLLGLSEMTDGTAYTYSSVPETVDLEINVTKIVENGFESDKLSHMTLKADGTAAEKSLISAVEKQELSPGMSEDITLFVNMNTFYKITSVLTDSKIESKNDFAQYSELISLSGIYICTGKLSMVSPVSTTLTEQNYSAYVLENRFDNFEKAVSTTYKVFILSSVGLVALSAVNIYLTVRAVSKIKKEEI